MPNSLVGANLDFATDIRGDLTAEVTFHLDVGLEPVTQRDEVCVGEVLDPGVRADPGRHEGLARGSATHSEDVGQADLHALVTREIHADETCHLVLCS